MPARNAAKAQSFGSSEGRGERKPELEQVRADIRHLGTSDRAGPAIRMQNAAGEVAGKRWNFQNFPSAISSRAWLALSVV